MRENCVSDNRGDPIKQAALQRAGSHFASEQRSLRFRGRTLLKSFLENCSCNVVGIFSNMTPLFQSHFLCDAIPYVPQKNILRGEQK